MCTEAMTIRASSLAELFDCPARWEAKHVRGLRLPSSPAAVLGHAVHAGTAAFDQARINGDPIGPDDAAAVAAEAAREESARIEVDWSGDLSPADVESIGKALCRLYCEAVSPAWEWAAVEATCEALHIEDLGLTLTGTTDRIYRDPVAGYGIADIKTGKRAVGSDGSVETAGHAAQIAVYELLAEASYGVPMTAPAVIMGLQAAKTDKGRRAGTGRIENARARLVGTVGGPGLLHHAANILASGSFYGNPRSKLCNKSYCPAWASCHWR